MSSQTVHCTDDRKPAIAANIKLSSLGSSCCNEYKAIRESNIIIVLMESYMILMSIRK